MPNPLKAIDKTETTITAENHMILFGTRDLTGADVPGFATGGKNADGSQGEYFTKSTKFDSAYTEMGRLLVDWEHGAMPDELDADEPIGYIDFEKATVTDEGLLVQRILNRRNAFVQAIEPLIDAGLIGSSSEAVPKGVHVNDDGHITNWPLKRDTLTVSPFEPQMLLSNPVALKAMQELSERIPGLKSLLPDGAMKTPVTVDGVGTDEPKPSNKEKNTMEPEKDQTKAVEAPAVDVAAIAKAAANEAVKAYQAELAAAKPVSKAGTDSKNVMTNMVTAEVREYDNIETGALALAASVLKASRKDVPEALYKAVGLRLEGDPVANKGAMSIKSFGKSAQAFSRFSKGVKANELTYSTFATAIDEWIGVAYSSELWDLIRNETMVLQRLGAPLEVPRGTESVTIPTLAGGVTFYKVAEATSMGANPGQTTNTVPVSQQTGGNSSLTLATMGAGVTWTGEVSHGSVVPYAEQLRRDIVASGREHLEAIMINGDTDASATTNINDIGGTPAGNEWFLIANGFRKSALITTAANSRSGGSFTSSDFLETVKLMGDGGRNALDTNKVGFIIDPATHYAALQLSDVKSRDVFSGATIENGRLTGVYGYSVDVSAEMHKGATGLLANTSGLVDLDTQANNTTGSILAVRWDQWKWGHDGAMTIESERVPRANATEITALTRVGLAQRDTEAAAITYNVTI